MRPCSPAPRRPSSGSTTSGAPRRCATRAARPATPRASSTPTARSFLHTLGVMAAGTMGDRRARPGAAGRPDVPRQRLGAGPRRGGRRRVAGHARTRPVAGGGRRPHRVGAGHRGGRGAHHLDGGAPRARRPRHEQPAQHRVRRLGGAQGAVRGLPGRHRAAHPPGLGHDRDQPGRRAVPPQVDPRGATSTRTAGPSCARASASRSSASRPASAGRTGSNRTTAAVGRQHRRRAAGPRPVDRRRLPRRPPLGRVVHRRRLAPDRRRRHHRPARLPPPGRPRQGRHQVRRRVDQLGRPRERADGPPAGGRGGRHRRRPTRGGASDRSPASSSAPAWRPRRTRRPTCSPSSSAGWRSGGCPTTSCSSTASRRRRSASSPRRTCGSSSPRPGRTRDRTRDRSTGTTRPSSAPTRSSA